MNTITEFLTYLGNSGFDHLTIPILIWTVLGLAALVIFKLSDNLHPAYQYHGRIAILCALPLGIMASYVSSWNIFSGTESSEALTKFFVIQNPISVTPAAEAETMNLLDPVLLTGFFMVLALVIMTGYLAKITFDLWSLYQFSNSLKYNPLEELPSVTEANKKLIGNKEVVKVAYSKQVEVPFTFGLVNKIVVLPQYLSEQPKKMNMALRHELIHIKHGDYLLNILLMTIKGTFWLHPLVHKFYKGFKDYREILCDAQVLADESIPQKGYAELLFELAPKNVFSNYPTVSMSVNSSTLKKRIQIMKTQHSKHTSTFSSSLTLMVLSLFFITGIMACTDIENNGITNSEIEEAQRQLGAPPPPVSSDSSEVSQPTFVLNGEVLEENERNLLSRIKTKYIENIEVLKGQKAIDEFGQELGKNGVVKMKLYDKEAALNDLNESSPPPPTSEKQQDYFKVVEDMPKLIGGQQALSECVQYPERAKRAGIEGRVTVSFIVNEEGNVENPEILRGIGAVQMKKRFDASNK
ncbi:MAG: TonB family protein [Balneolaceae bacterium]|nr:TonB family protein [Balneolaceae bacterium]